MEEDVQPRLKSLLHLSVAVTHLAGKALCTSSPPSFSHLLMLLFVFHLLLGHFLFSPTCPVDPPSVCQRSRSCSSPSSSSFLDPPGPSSRPAPVWIRPGLSLWRNSFAAQLVCGVSSSQTSLCLDEIQDGSVPSGSVSPPAHLLLSVSPVVSGAGLRWSSPPISVSFWWICSSNWFTFHGTLLSLWLWTACTSSAGTVS